MKTKLTALTLSACLLGLSSAAPEEKKGDQAPQIAPAAQQDRHTNRKADRNKTAEAADKDRAARHARKTGERKAERTKAAETKDSVARINDAHSRQAADAGKKEEERKAQTAAANKKAEEEKMHRTALTRLNELITQKKIAEANRGKAADALKLSERKLAAINSEINRINGELKAKADMDRRKSEQARAQRSRETAAREQAMISSMRNEIRQLKQAVERLTQQVGEK